ncbi:tetratricopeptide repeat protein [Halobacillus salinarum]|uniref:Tetratricopeptide repeat protein n=1 Tax=Halobacillus salinarum TaxID=2932257 RepID=A0ABY4EPY1_9BACI|nr:tetratricopeptide repeat protein [Halobacillus salinarum]UOQ46228.1 tetratricopeptide repeat protein [Halobacillus salinarum]
MENQKGNIVMFPKWRKRLEQEGLQAVKDKRYQDAAQALRPLLDYKVANHDVITGLLMSWIELGQLEEAEELCRQQMKVDEENYYEYLHIYITILFQDSRYQELIDLLDEVFHTEEVPHQNRTQLWQMYEVSKKLLEETHKSEGEKYSHHFFEALENNDVHNQWQMLSRLLKQPAQHYAEMYKPLLMKESVHPIIKTAIIEWFRDSGFSDHIKVKKFGQYIEVTPSELNQLHSDYILKQVQMRLGSIEQSNPTMFDMLNQLLYHYCYVRYPIFPDEHEVPVIVEALKQIGHEYLQLPYNYNNDLNNVSIYKEEIETCEQHYLAIVEQ